MTSDLRPYPEMKDSGVGALGRVPAHWRVRKLGQIGRFSKGNGGSKVDELQIGIPCIRYGDLYTSHTYFIHQSRGCISRERVEDYTPIIYGDVLFAASGETTEEIGKSAVNLIKDEAYCGGDIILFRPSIEAHPKFMGYVTDFRPATDQKARMGRGFTVVHVYSDQLKRLSVPLPPLREQTSIVRFLDHADQRIQRYIRAKEKLIALLEEQKQAIIHQAVTGQIDVRTGRPYPAYKDSGVEWLGRVPEHWDVRRLCAVARITTGGKDTIDKEVDGQFPFFVRSQVVERINSWSFEGEAVLTAGDGVGVGKVFHYVNGKFDYHQRVYKFSHFESVLGRFFFHVIRSLLKFEVMQGTAKATVDSLRLPMLRNFPVLVPVISEQAAISAFVDDLDGKFARALAGVNREIELLQEYRARIVSDVVTGKLDIREAPITVRESEFSRTSALSDESLSLGVEPAVEEEVFRVAAVKI